jgi:hypothetical protein
MRRLYAQARPVRFTFECWVLCDPNPPRVDKHGERAVYRDPCPFPHIRIFGRTR